MAPFTYSVERFHAVSWALSTGYTDIASDFLPPGRFILAASQTKAADDAQATSRELVHLNFQVSLSFDGRLRGSVTSISDRSITVLSLSFACCKRLTCSFVNTSEGFSNSP